MAAVLTVVGPTSFAGNQRLAGPAEHIVRLARHRPSFSNFVGGLGLPNQVAREMRLAIAKQNLLDHPIGQIEFDGKYLGIRAEDQELEIDLHRSLAGEFSVRPVHGEVEKRTVYIKGGDVSDAHFLRFGSGDSFADIMRQIETLSRPNDLEARFWGWLFPTANALEPASMVVALMAGVVIASILINYTFARLASMGASGADQIISAVESTKLIQLQKFQCASGHIQEFSYAIVPGPGVHHDVRYQFTFNSENLVKVAQSGTNYACDYRIDEGRFIGAGISLLPTPESRQICQRAATARVRVRNLDPHMPVDMLDACCAPSAEKCAQALSKTLAKSERL